MFPLKAPTGTPPGQTQTPLKCPVMESSCTGNDHLEESPAPGNDVLYIPVNFLFDPSSFHEIVLNHSFTADQQVYWNELLINYFVFGFLVIHDLTR